VLLKANREIGEGRRKSKKNVHKLRARELVNWSGSVWFSGGLLMLDQGVWAEIKVGEEHLRLFSEHNAQGVQASVYNVNAKNWVAPSEAVGDIEEGKDKAAAHARAYLKRAGYDEMPALEWKKARAV
jgi:hypothetical protein